MRPDLPQEHKPNNPFHVLKDLPAQPKPAATRIRKSREFDFVQPFYLKKLLDFCGSTKETGERIGITDSSVSEGIRTGKIRKITELAARAVYELDCVPPPCRPDRYAGTCIRLHADRPRGLRGVKALAGLGWRNPQNFDLGGCHVTQI